MFVEQKGFQQGFSEGREIYIDCILESIKEIDNNSTEITGNIYDYVIDKTSAKFKEKNKTD